ncbi:hypothetical protein WMY93_022404 [Mugilogobius chulae]|uniref:Uncharacterized protein n=1 Tax=Mugilogobius chulae TaxID=88201 RepID=A0AAW0NI27_9GOBI
MSKSRESLRFCLFENFVMLNQKSTRFISSLLSLLLNLVLIPALTRKTSLTEPPEGGALGPTLGLVKSSSLESLQTAMEEARGFSQVPFHKPRPHMVRGRGCNMSFRQAIDKSYEGPSEDDDDLSGQSSGHETPASTSSRNDLDADENTGKKKKKTKGKKKEKKTKTKKEATEEKKKKGFNLLSCTWLSFNQCPLRHNLDGSCSFQNSHFINA